MLPFLPLDFSKSHNSTEKGWGSLAVGDEGSYRPKRRCFNLRDCEQSVRGNIYISEAGRIQDSNFSEKNVYDYRPFGTLVLNESCEIEETFLKTNFCCSFC